MEKTCRDCRATKPASEFYKDKARADNLSIRCKACFNAKAAEYQMRPPRHQTPDGMKRCTLCKETKAQSEFPRNKNFHDGLDRSCKACGNARSSVYAKENREALSQKQNARYHADPLRYADYELKKRLGMEPGDYDRMLANQSGKCGICGTDDPGSRTRRRTRRFAVDHCHTTGTIRGLLCSNCNRGIGYLKHSCTVLSAAIKYLQLSEGSGARS